MLGAGSILAAARIVLRADTSELEHGLHSAERRFDQTTRRFEDGSKRHVASFKAIGLAAAGVAAGGLSLFALGIGKSIAAAREAEVVQAKMRAQLRALGIDYSKHAKAIDETITKERELSGFTNEELTGSFTNLVRATGDVSKALKLNALAADIARAKHVDLNAASLIVTKALMGNVGALRRMGIDVQKVTAAQDELKASGGKLTQAQKEQAKASDLAATKQRLLGELQQRFAGQAEAYGKTAAGAQDRFRASVRALEEQIGKGLLPTLSQLFGTLARWLDALQRSKTAHEVLHKTIQVVGAGIREIKKDFETVARTFQAHRAEMQSLWNGIAAVVQKVVVPALKFFGKTMVAEFKGAVLVIGGLVRGFGAVKDAISGAWSFARRATITFFSWFVQAAEKLLSVAVSAFGWAPGIGGKLKSAKRTVDDWLARMRADAASGGAAAGDAWSSQFASHVKPPTGVRGPVGTGGATKKPPGSATGGFAPSSIVSSVPAPSGGGGSGGGSGGAKKASTSADAKARAKQAAVVREAEQLGPGSGITYVAGGTDPHVGFDCSGYLWRIYKDQGIDIPRTSEAQWADPNAIHVPTGKELPADGVYFTGSSEYAPPGHCGIYVGGGKFIEYYSHGKPARVSNLRDKGDYWGARRWIKIKQSGGGPGGPAAGSPASKAKAKADSAARARAETKEQASLARTKALATVPGVGGAIGTYNDTKSGRRQVGTETIAGQKIPIYTSITPTIEDWKKVRAQLIEALKKLVTRRKAVIRSLKVAMRAKYPDNRMIAALRQTLAKLDQEIAAVVADLSDVDSTIADLKAAAAASGDVSGGEGAFNPGGPSVSDALKQGLFGAGVRSIGGNPLDDPSVKAALAGDTGGGGGGGGSGGGGGGGGGGNSGDPTEWGPGGDPGQNPVRLPPYLLSDLSHKARAEQMLGYMGGLRGLRAVDSVPGLAGLRSSTITVTNYFTQPPLDPLHFSRSLEFELKALVG